MPSQTHFTIPQISAIVSKPGWVVPNWKTRRVADFLDGDIQRIGLYRLIPAEMVPRIERELRRQGWLPKIEGAACQ